MGMYGTVTAVCDVTVVAYDVMCYVLCTILIWIAISLVYLNPFWTSHPEVFG